MVPEDPPTEEVLRRELSTLRMQLRNDVHKELAEFRAGIKQDQCAKATLSKPVALRRAASSLESPGKPRQNDQPHVWVGRHIRGYNIAAELEGHDSDDDDAFGDLVDRKATSKSVKARLLPDVLPKASGPFSRIRIAGEEGRRRSQENSEAEDEGTPAPKVVAKPLFAPKRQQTTPNLGTRSNVHQSGSSPKPGDPTSSSPTHVEQHATVNAMKEVRSCSPISSDDSSGGEDVKADKVAVAPEDHASSSEENVDEGPSPRIKSALAPSLKTASADRRRQILSSSSRFLNFTKVVPDEVKSEASFMFPRMPHYTNSRWHALRSRLRIFVRSLWFDYITMVVIISNAVTIGWQTDHQARTLEESPPNHFLVLERVFAVFFLTELLLRLLAYGSRFWFMPEWKWNCLDVFVVALQCGEELMQLLNFGPDQIRDSGAISVMRMFRMLRLVRIIRVVRLLRYLTELRTITHSVMSSMKPLLSTILLLFMVIYIVGIYLVQVTAHHRIDTGYSPPELEEYFGSVSMAVLSLFQTVTGGMEWRTMLEPLLVHISPLMGIVFSLYIVFTLLALMNIVTGVFVDTATSRGKKAKDVLMINHLKELFEALDMNRNGIISWHEFLGHLGDPRLNMFLKEIDIDSGEAKGLFVLLDRDGGGTVDADEFLSGCLRLRGPAKALDMQLVLRELSEQRNCYNRLLDAIEGITEEAEESPSGGPGSGSTPLSGGSQMSLAGGGSSGAERLRASITQAGNSRRLSRPGGESVAAVALEAFGTPKSATPADAPRNSFSGTWGSTMSAVLPGLARVASTDNARTSLARNAGTSGNSEAAAWSTTMVATLPGLVRTSITESAGPVALG